MTERIATIGVKQQTVYTSPKDGRTIMTYTDLDPADKELPYYVYVGAIDAKGLRELAEAIARELQRLADDERYEAMELSIAEERAKNGMPI